jgi:hypothetical protein
VFARIHQLWSGLCWDVVYPEIFRRFPYSVRANAGMVPRLVHDPSIQIHSSLSFINHPTPITVAARPKARTVFARSNAGIVGSNPTQGMDVCMCVYSVCVGSGLATGWSPVQGVLPTLLGLRNWSETKRFMDALCSKVGATGKRERERIVLLFDSI